MLVYLLYVADGGLSVAVMNANCAVQPILYVPYVFNLNSSGLRSKFGGEQQGSEYDIMIVILPIAVSNY